MKHFIFSILLGIFSVAFAASSTEYLDLEEASSRMAIAQSDPELPVQQWKEFEDFLCNPVFSRGSVLSSLEKMLPEMPKFIWWLEPYDLLKTACNIKRLHFLSAPLKETYENIFCCFEFVIKDLFPEDMSRLWSCVTGCGYQLPPKFLEELSRQTEKKAKNFTDSLALSTLWHVSILPESRAFRCLKPMLSRMINLYGTDDFHKLIFLTAYISEVKGEEITLTRDMKNAIETYQRYASYSLTTSEPQHEVASFLQNFNPKFECEAFYKSLDTHLDIADEASKIVVDMDGCHHYKEEVSGSKQVKRPLDVMRDAILLNRGWKVYRLTPVQWTNFKEKYATKMTKEKTLKAFYQSYAVSA